MGLIRKCLFIRLAIPTRRGSELFPSHAECIGNPIDIVKPSRNQGDLQNSSIIESCCSQSFMIVLGNARGIARRFRHVIKHDSICIRDRRGLVVLLQRSHQIVIQSHATQKLCVRFDSIMTAIEN